MSSSRNRPPVIGPFWRTRPAEKFRYPDHDDRRGSSTRRSMPVARPLATAFGKMMVVPAKTLGSATSVIVRRHTAASRPNPRSELVIHAGLEHPLPFGFELRAATAAFRRKRRENPRFFRGRQQEVLGLRRLKESADRSAQHRAVRTRYAAPTRGLSCCRRCPGRCESKRTPPLTVSPLLTVHSSCRKADHNIGFALSANTNGWSMVYASAASLNPASSASSGSVTAK